MFFYLSIRPAFSHSQENSALKTMQDREHYFVESNEVYCVLKKRKAYPGTFCYQPNKEEAMCGYGSSKASPASTDEFLRVEISGSGELRITRDVYCTLPLFYGFAHGVCIISNSYEAVIQNLPERTLNKPMLIESLGAGGSRRETLLQEIKMFNEREVLHLKNGKLSIHSPPPRPWLRSMDAPATNPADFLPYFESRLEHFIHTRLAGGQAGFEISAGLDSSLLPLYIARHYPDMPIVTSTLQYPDEFRKSQTQKLHELQTILKATPVVVPLEGTEHFPLARMIIPNTFQAFNIFDEIYTEPLEETMEALKAHGIQVAVTGIGGDDLFENTVGLTQQLRCNLPPFATPQLGYALRSQIPHEAPYPLPLLSIATHGAQASRNNVFIKYGIWPVSPFTDVGLYEFCQGLPAHFRANKNILRLYYQVNHFPESIYNPTENEHFGHFFNKAFMSSFYSKIITQLASQSVTAQYGYVDLSKLLKTYPLIQAGKLEIQWLYSLYVWLCIEINLQLT